MARQEIWTGENCYLIIEKNSMCPYRKGGNLIEDGAGNVVMLNGIVYISSSFLPPYDSFTNIVVASPGLIAWVIDIDTGELRYYDGIQADETEYWTPQQRSIGKVTSMSIDYKRPIEVHSEIGSCYPSDIQATVYSNELDIKKCFIDKRKIVPTKENNVWTQFGFLGNGLIEVPDYVDGKVQDYYLVILHIRDEADASVRQTIICPCTKFSDFREDNVTDKILECSIKGESTYLRTLPYDDNIPDYPFHLPECAEYLHIGDEGEEYRYVGRKVNIAIFENFFQGQVFEVTESIDLCAIYPYIYGKVGTPQPMICRIYGATPNPVLPILASTESKVHGDIVLGAYNEFQFATPFTLVPGFYIVTVETTLQCNDDEYYILNAEIPGSYAGGNNWQNIADVWPMLIGNWLEDEIADLRIKIYTV